MSREMETCKFCNGRGTGLDGYKDCPSCEGRGCHERMDGPFFSEDEAIQHFERLDDETFSGDDLDGYDGDAL